MQHTFVRTALFGLGALPGLAAAGLWLRATSRDALAWAPFATATVILTASASWHFFARPLSTHTGTYAVGLVRDTERKSIEPRGREGVRDP